MARTRRLHCTIWNSSTTLPQGTARWSFLQAWADPPDPGASVSVYGGKRETSHYHIFKRRIAELTLDG